MEFLPSVFNCFLCLVLFAQQLRLSQCVKVSVNPWLDHDFYTPSDIQASIDQSIRLHPSEASKFARVKEIGVAWWFDNIAQITAARPEFQTADQIRQQPGQAPLAVITVIYNLPNRDCAAGASNGEISCANAACATGLNTYRTEYIDKIAALLAEFPQLTFILILEPDSLPNLATNAGVNRCPNAGTAYVDGIAYAIEVFSRLDNVAIYMDAAHGGWLGWLNNQELFAGVVNQVLSSCTNSVRNSGATTVRIDGQDVPITNDFSCAQLVRGFSSNIAGYQPTGCATTCTADVWDACGLSQNWNQQFTEVLYAISMENTLIAECGFESLGWVIDTSRNGVIDARSDCSNWCNIDGSGLGYPTQGGVSSYTETDAVDAFAWIKVPGESDGISDQNADRFHATCTSEDSLTNAPEAGDWFDEMFVMLVQNANPAIEAVEPATPSPTEAINDDIIRCPDDDRPGYSSCSEDDNCADCRRWGCKTCKPGFYKKKNNLGVTVCQNCQEEFPGCESCSNWKGCDGVCQNGYEWKWNPDCSRKTCFFNEICPWDGVPIYESCNEDDNCADCKGWGCKTCKPGTYKQKPLGGGKHVCMPCDTQFPGCAGECNDWSGCGNNCKDGYEFRYSEMCDKRLCLPIE